MSFLYFVWQEFSQASSIKILESPTLGIYNLSGSVSAQIIEEDIKSFGHIFSSVIESTNAPPTWNVLFLYCYIEPDGGVHESHLGLREIIRVSGALIVVVASENPAENYEAAAKDTGYGYANLAMTLDRKGDKFPIFYQRLFTEMKQGVSMPVAWNKLAPQIPGVDHIDSPDGFGVWGAGQVAFK
ncbi:MAG TPA: hypothetical protein VIS72_15410 [Anaerolineales bacterium]